MMGHFVFRNLFHRPVRTLIGVLAIAVEVMLVVLIVGLTSGILQETAKRIEGIGADIMVQAPAAQILIGFSGSPMPIKIADKLANSSTSRRSRPPCCNLIPRAAWRRSGASIQIVPRRSLTALFFSRATICRGPTIYWSTIGRQSQAPSRSATPTISSITIGTSLASWSTARAAACLCPSRTLQDLVGARDKASIFLVKCTRPEHTKTSSPKSRNSSPITRFARSRNS